MNLLAYFLGRRKLLRVATYLRRELHHRELWCRIHSKDYYLLDPLVSNLMAAQGLIDAVWINEFGG